MRHASHASHASRASHASQVGLYHSRWRAARAPVVARAARVPLFVAAPARVVLVAPMVHLGRAVLAFLA